MSMAVFEPELPSIDTAVLVDYAYLFDYTNNVYTPLNFDAGQGAGARTGHVGKSYWFLF
jgi:hypothetical protein